MPITLYHNPRCSKSREACALLADRQIPVEIILYLDTPPDIMTLTALMHMLGVHDPRQMMRPKEAEYAELDLANPAHSTEYLLNAMSTHPRLIERPILVKDGKALIARPPERIFELLD